MTGFADLAGDWNDVQERSGSGYQAVPDGRHLAVIKDMSVDINDKGQSLKTVIYFPTFNKEETSWQPLTKSALRFVKMTLKAAHLDGYGPNEVEAHLGEARMRKVYVTKKTNGKYRNYYFEAAGDQPEEEVPFD